MQAHPHSEELFLLLGKLVPRVAVELVVTRKNNQEVLLTRRPKNDPYWRNQWHVPGGYIWYRESIKHAINRIAKRELNVSMKKHSFIGMLEFEKEKENPRNHTISLVYVCSPTRKVKQGKYFALDDIPQDFLYIQHKILDLVVRMRVAKNI